jgi:hypothetical protein
MPFNLRNLVPIGGANRPAAPGTGESTTVNSVAYGNGAFTLWAYRTEDAAATVDTAGYFNGARAMLTAGDVIMRLTVNSTGVPQTVGLHLVNDVPATGNVDVADALAITVTDTD